MPEETTEKKKVEPMDIGATFKALNARGISKSTCEFFEYGVGSWNNEPAQFAQYYTADGSRAGVKVRLANKKFMWSGAQPGTFFGQQKFSGGKMLVITEGELDAMS